MGQIFLDLLEQTRLETGPRVGNPLDHAVPFGDLSASSREPSELEHDGGPVRL